MNKKSVTCHILLAVLVLAVGIFSYFQSEFQKTQIESLQNKLDSADLQQQLLDTAAVANQSSVTINTYHVIMGASDSGGFTGGKGAQKEIQIPMGQGSGVTVGKDLVLTCWHIVKNGERITVQWQDGEEREGSIVKKDVCNDLVVIKVPGLETMPAQFGSFQGVKLGQPVLCAGTPASEKLYNSLSFGIISGLNRKMPSLHEKNQMVEVFQTDAAINGGSSGGGIFDLNGNLIGIVSRKYVTAPSSNTQLEGIGIGIPADCAKALLDEKPR